MLVLVSQLDLHEQIDGSPDRVQQAGEREVEESQPEILRRRRGHESLDRPVAALDFPPIPVLSEKSAHGIGHKHRVLPVVVVLSVLFAPVDQRRLVPLVVPEKQLPVGFVSVLIAVE